MRYCQPVEIVRCSDVELRRSVLKGKLEVFSGKSFNQFQVFRDFSFW